MVPDACLAQELWVLHEYNQVGTNSHKQCDANMLALHLGGL